MKPRSFTFLYLLTFLYAANIFAADPNVVISHLDSYYKLIPAKGGEKLDRIDNVIQTTFLAKRTADKAIAMEFYDSDIKINKASGGEIKYGVYSSGDVFFDDSKTISVIVDLKKPGATGKATISRAISRPEFFNKVIIAESYDILSATYTFEVPASMESRFSFEPVNFPEGTLTQTKERKGDKILYIFTFKDLKESKHFSDAPSYNICGPQIRIRGQFKDVNDLYRYLRSYTTTPDSDPQSIENKTKEIIADCRTDAERVSAITRWVHDNIRYVAVEHGEYGQRPDQPSEVMRKRFADCKGSANLLKAMFRAAGLDGRLVWIGTNSIAERWTDFPATSCGNHMIAAVVSPDSILFVDGTTQFTNPPDYPDAIQGQQALIEDTPESCITAIVPIAPDSANCKQTDFTISIDNEGNLNGKGRVKMSGLWRNAMQYIMQMTPPAKHEKTLIDLLIEDVGGHSATLSGHSVDDTCFIYEGNATGLGSVKKVGTDTYVDLNPMPGLAKFKFDTKDRTLPGWHESTNRFNMTLTLNVPEGMKAIDLPAPVSVASPYLDATVSTKIADSGRTVVRNIILTLRRGIIPLNELNRVNTDINKLIRACSASIILTPAN